MSTIRQRRASQERFWLAMMRQWRKQRLVGAGGLPEAGGRAAELPDLQMLLDGVDLASVQRQKRFRRPNPAIPA